MSNFRSGGDFDNESWALFAQGTYDLTDRLHLTLGLRYTEEDKSFKPDQIIFQNYFAGISTVVPPGNPLAALDAPFLQAGERILPLLEKQVEIEETTPMATLSYDLTDSVMVYASYSGASSPVVLVVSPSSIATALRQCMLSVWIDGTFAPRTKEN